MDKVGGSMEDETEDQILARALEESLRHYNEVEIPRLSQITNNVEMTTGDCQETIPDEDMDCWEEWDVEDINGVVEIEESIQNIIPTEPNGIEIKKKSLESTKASAQFMNKYVLHEIRPKQSTISVGEEGENGADGFDMEAGKSWIYPKNYPVRKYQLDIVHSALFDNTLVSLPTGLGKTFIAAVIMYNFYRWFPSGKIIFLAPTRPLVAQQVQACYEIMGIPKSDTIELTGSKNASERAKAWKEKRVFFATPQVLANDLATGICPGDQVRCVVVDEAHRAAGNHAICQAIRSLLRLREQSPGSRCRIIALSATPGKNIPSVANVVTTLRISKLELRDEQSADVAPYTHQRNIETVVVPIGPELSETRNVFLKSLIPVLDRLMTKKVLYCGDKTKISKYQILSARINFRNNSQKCTFHERGLIEGDFALAITLAHALGLLLTHGQRTFMNFLQGSVDGDRGTPIVKARLKSDPFIPSLLSKLKEKFGTADSMLQPAPDVSLSQKMAVAFGAKKVDRPFITSHPKMDFLKDIIIAHFEKYGNGEESTRVMVFCEYRDPVVEICNMLMCYWPQIKPMSFVGQATASMGFDNVPGTSKGTKGFTQKQQLQAIRGFREGGYNVLVSTCVGEEGLDIGEVDLIICYDAPHSSPLRLVQRMGRTGRKREGRVVTLVTQDWEEHKHKSGLRQKNTIVKSLINSKMLANVLCRNNPRVLPPGINPQCHMMPMILPKEEDDADEKKGKKGKGKGSKSKNPSNTKKGKGKSKTITDDGSGEEGIDENNECNLENGLDTEEGISKKGKSKGKTKGKRKTGKVSPAKNQGKGIQDFFKNHRLKDTEPIFNVDEDFEDDDFIGVVKQQTKNLEEVVVVDEDEPVLYPERVSLRQSTDSNNFILSPDLQSIESAVTSIFGNTHCHCMEDSFLLTCNVMATHFQLRHTNIELPNLEPDMSLEFLTAELILNFDAKEEAKKAGDWNLDVPLQPVDVFSFKTIPILMKEHTSINSSPKNSKCKYLVNNLNGTDIGGSCRKESVSFTEKDGDQRSLKGSQIKNKTHNTPDVSHVEHNGQESKLLWNVFGQQKKEVVAAEDVIILEADDSDSGINNKMDKVSDEYSEKDFKCNKDQNNGKFNESKGIESVSAANSPPNDFDITHFDVSGKSTPDNLPLPMEIPLKSKEFCIENHPINQFNSPDAVDLECASISGEATPDHLPLPQESTSKSTICLSPIIGNRKGHFIITSSTPKVHRKNLFPTSVYSSSPVKGEKSISANFDLIPSDIELSDHEELSVVKEKPLSAEKPAILAENIESPAIISPCEELDGKGHDYIVPNFDLGWDDAFDSDATFVDFEDEMFEGSKMDESKDGSSKISPLIKQSHTKHLESQIKDSKYSWRSLAEKEKGDDSSKSYVEKSSELCSGIKKKNPFPITREKFLKRNIKDDVHNQQNHSHFYTVTQMIDILADADIPSTSHEIKKEGMCKNKLIEEDENFSSKFESENVIGNNVSEVRESINSSPVKRLKSEAQECGIPTDKGEKCIPQNINFDIGDDALLDISADLFAEDDTEDWLRESGENSEANPVVKEEIVNRQKKSLEDIKINPSAYKRVENLSITYPDKDLRLGGKVPILPETEIRTEPQKLNSIVPVPTIPGWKADWLTKTVTASDSKLSLSRKIKKEEEPKAAISSNQQSLSFKRPEIMGKDMNAKNIAESRNHLQDVESKDDDGSGWIDEITTEKRDPKIQIPNNDPIKATTQNAMKFQSAPLCSDNFKIPYDKPLNKMDAEEGMFLESPPKKTDKIHLERNSNSKFIGSETIDKVKDSKSSSWGRDVAVVKPISVDDVITISSDEDDTDCESKREDKPSDSHENWIKEVEKDVYDWELSDWLENEGNDIKCQEPIGSSDDFESLENKKKPKKAPIINTSKETSASSEEKPPVRPRKASKSKRRCEFLESQAEESFCEPGIRKLSSDEDDECDKGNSQYYDPSFINDGLPHSEEEDVDIQAKYLQSVRSPRNPKFKIPDLPAIISLKENDYQPYGDPESCYMNDSFCVDGESEENASEGNAESSVDELEVLEAILSKKTRKKKKKKIESSSEDEVIVLREKIVLNEEEVKSKKRKRKRKRIIMHDSSDEDEIRKCDPPSKKVSLDKKISPEYKQAKSSSLDSAASCASSSNIKGKNEEIPPRPMSSDSRGITERRTYRESTDDSHRKVIDMGNNHGIVAKSTSSSGVKNSETLCQSKSEKIVNSKLIDEINSNWSGDIFDIWNWSDEEVREAKNENIPSHSTKKSSEEEIASKNQRGSLEHGNATNQVFKLPTSNHIKTETKHVDQFGKSKFIPKTEASSSYDNLGHSDVKIGNNAKEQFSTHPKEGSTSTLKTCVVTPFVNSNSTASTSNMSADFETLIVVSPTEACRATDVVSTLRTTRKIQLVVFATSGNSFIPYSLGRDLCLFRFSVSELGHGSKATEHLQAAHKLYRKISVILEWGDEIPRDQWPQRRSGNRTNSSGPISLSSMACSTLMNLGNASIKVLHSSGKNETAKLIAELARHHQRLEINSGMVPIILPKPFSQSDPKLKFYSTLPGVNSVLAIHLLKKFPKISNFLSRCSSARSIQASTGLDLNKSLHLYKTLSGVNTSET